MTHKEQNLKKHLQESLSLEEFLFLSFYMKAHMGFGYLITRQAIERKECRGLHYTIDYPVHAYDKKD